jgi:hypothetical protein
MRWTMLAIWLFVDMLTPPNINKAHSVSQFGDLVNPLDLRGLAGPPKLFLKKSYPQGSNAVDK